MNLKECTGIELSILTGKEEWLQEIYLVETLIAEKTSAQVEEAKLQMEEF